MEEPKPERVAKIMAAAGLCSRRQAEEWIADGRVSLNGQKLTTPAVTVGPKDALVVDGRKIDIARTQTKQPRLWLLHKPAGWVTTARDPEGRPTVFDQLPASMGRVISVGRLDLNSEGLLLLTNDGGLARAMELPRTGLPRQYRVRVHGDVNVRELASLKNGIVVDGIEYGAIDARVEKASGSNTWVVMTLHEGKNREIRRVMSALGLQVNRLIRTAYGPFELGTLPVGASWEVPAARVQNFIQQIGGV